ncbi:hypothetical protein F0562_005946 [Nyssa sinensis]|uniref:Uncharacterized protein n=1 Tax=Nyssa sinensis TaxID=561372 RepID=A0A5J5APB1_9ASTE|nr:hypothetical protein F0562_005946 [Nyssa sinensis]
MVEEIRGTGKRTKGPLSDKEGGIESQLAEVSDPVKLLKMAASVNLGVGSLVWAEDSDTAWIDGEVGSGHE